MKIFAFSSSHGKHFLSFCLEHLVATQPQKIEKYSVGSGKKFCMYTECGKPQALKEKRASE
jgi:hypothetical protein